MMVARAMFNRLGARFPSSFPRFLQVAPAALPYAMLDRQQVDPPHAMLACCCLISACD
jgi:hypothetical protein